MPKEICPVGDIIKQSVSHGILNNVITDAEFLLCDVSSYLKKEEKRDSIVA